MENPRTLIFEGSITGGAGAHSEMIFPGQMNLPDAPEDWPEQLCPGSLNVLVDKYPDNFRAPVGRAFGAYQLDDGEFQPAFIIPGDDITKNELIYEGGPSAAQVWRAQLHVTDSDKTICCWILRRFGSNVGKGKSGNVLEIVSETHLRRTHGLKDGEKVALELMCHK